ncbi:uncharacterized protein MONBRDRAFT_7546 [Monosiga brevicollis MX1]|uniref:TNFR-Cys domain-containing protein n=1 Tax=Monosiga brevicollis TaxID=81824 RepID=A9UXB4_MONBE|nr:uncharacterized protein MONBRDRAFT_7546 [Monosiga brevicollis MX1]EDQ90189.1 predicted protein [Monosiga brevicollis MX1]|eukprot:XP_001744956.1 hypothetical protein [Monosiga brevicollis MX1]
MKAPAIRLTRVAATARYGAKYQLPPLVLLLLLLVTQLPNAVAVCSTRVCPAGTLAGNGPTLLRQRVPPRLCLCDDTGYSCLQYGNGTEGCEPCTSGTYSADVTDTLCLACRNACDPASEFEVVPCTRTTNRMCSTCTVCGTQEWMAADCTETTDRDCRACTQPTDCPVGQVYRGHGGDLLALGTIVLCDTYSESLNATESEPPLTRGRSTRIPSRRSIGALAAYTLGPDSDTESDGASESTAPRPKISDPIPSAPAIESLPASLKQSAWWTQRDLARLVKDLKAVETQFREVPVGCVMGVYAKA